MSHYMKKSWIMLPLFFVLVLFFGKIEAVKADPSCCANRVANQVTYYYGGYWYRNPGAYWGPGYVYYGPRYYNRSVWTGWRPYRFHGNHCRRSCLVNQWNGLIVRCVRRCY